MSALPFPLPPLQAVLLRRRSEALAAFTAAGWRTWSAPRGLDEERRRLLNVDLSEPEVFFPERGGAAAVAHVEADRGGLITLLEITAAVPVRPEALADLLLPGAGEPRVGGGADAREWIWGPEAGHTVEIDGEPVRLWVCAERAYGDRLWAVASIVRRASTGDDE